MRCSYGKCTAASFVLFVAICSLTGCHMAFKNFSSGIQGSGIVATESREVAPFSRISMGGIGTVNVSIGPEQSVTVTSDDNLLEFISTTVVGDTLKIDLTESINTSTPLEYDIVVDQLTSLKISGAAKFNIDGLDGDQFSVDLSGASSGTASGTVRDLDIEVSGAAKARFAELEAETAKVDLSGASSVDVFASQSFDGSVSGAGKVNVYGNPADVKKSVSGVGKIRLK